MTEFVWISNRKNFKFGFCHVGEKN